MSKVSPKNHIVYVIKRPNETKDPRKYYGVTSYGKVASPKHRWIMHKLSNSCVGKFVRKHEDAQMHILYENLTKQKAYDIEKQLVPEDYSTRKKMHLLNQCGGGTVAPCSDSFSEETKRRKSENLSKSLKAFYQKNEWARKRNSEKMKAFYDKNPHLRYRNVEYLKKANTRKYQLLSPENKLITEKDMSLAELAKEIGCAATNLSRVLHGKTKSIKGYRLPKNKNYKAHIKLDYCLKSPDGQIYKGTNVSKFCKEHNLDGCYVRRMIKGANGNPKYKRYKSHRGWTVVVHHPKNDS